MHLHFFLKNFGELWDIFIDDRTKKYKQTFKDKNYEQILHHKFLMKCLIQM